MTIEDTLSRIAFSLERIAVCLENGTPTGSLQDVPAETVAAKPVAEVVAPKAPAPTQAPAETAKRGRGRPRKDAAPAEPTPEPAAEPEPVVEESAFDEPAPVREIGIEEVRNALISLQKRTTPETARKLLRDVGGADTLRALTPDKYAAVHAAAERA